MARLRLDWNSLKERFPTLIYGSVSGYGQNGPWGDRGGFDVMAQGISGLMSINGPTDRSNGKFQGTMLPITPFG